MSHLMVKATTTVSGAERHWRLAAMSGMEIDDHIAALERTGTLLAKAADSAGPDAVVPTCPGWRVRDLRPARRLRASVGDRVRGRAALRDGAGADRSRAACCRASRRQAARLVHRRAGSAHGRSQPGGSAPWPAWTFLPAPSPLAFWARRQAHETAIHRADAELAAGGRPGYPADLAADGVDELLIGFFGRDAAQAGRVTADRSAAADHGRVLVVRAVDTQQAWHVRLSQDGSRILATGRGNRSGLPGCRLHGQRAGIRAVPAAVEPGRSGDRRRRGQRRGEACWPAWGVEHARDLGLSRPAVRAARTSRPLGWSP